MFSDTLEILLLLGITAALITLYHKASMFKLEREKEETARNISDLRLKYGLLLTKNSKLEEEASNFEAKLSSMRGETGKLEHELQSYKVGQESLQANISFLENYRQKNDELISRLKVLDSENADMKIIIRKMEREQTTLKSEISHLNLLLKDKYVVSEELAVLKKEHSRVMSENTQLRGELYTLQGKLKITSL